MTPPELRALKPTEVVMALNQVPGWVLSGNGDLLAIEKTYEFSRHNQVMLFINSVGWLAEKLDHHPEVVLNYRRCVVRWRTHSVQGLSALDFDAAAQTDTLLLA